MISKKGEGLSAFPFFLMNLERLEIIFNDLYYLCTEAPQKSMIMKYPIGIQSFDRIIEDLCICGQNRSDLPSDA